MKSAKIILWCVAAVAVLYGVVLLIERMTTQELTRVSHPQTSEIVCLMWQPRLLGGNGVVYLDLLNAQGKKTDSAPLRVLDTGFNALQQFGQLAFEDQILTVSNLKTGDVVQRFVLKDGRLGKVE